MLKKSAPVFRYCLVSSDEVEVVLSFEVQNHLNHWESGTPAYINLTQTDALIPTARCYSTWSWCQTRPDTIPKAMCLSTWKKYLTCPSGHNFWDSMEPGGQTLSDPHHPDSVRCTRCPNFAKIGENNYHQDNQFILLATGEFAYNNTKHLCVNPSVSENCIKLVVYGHHIRTKQFNESLFIKNDFKPKKAKFSLTFLQVFQLVNDVKCWAQQNWPNNCNFAQEEIQKVLLFLGIPTQQPFGSLAAL
ncbi:hypothetical protein PROFUN_12305 [Planoprotostelium fungivorum]|uniref:Uncharacterized protein n=1 Tax=Planoprotostelium fungivorum TaxID=1890364 RepID=A0A2P6N7U2_9EUKA|nr:hypothetical protein PROFUN_12305 [Planoprotostelium fungivorum]